MCEKTCRACGVTKPLSEFYKNAKLKSGFRSPCKACCATTKRAYRQTPKGKAARKADRAKYNESPKGKAAAKASRAKYLASPHGRAVHGAAGRRYRKSPNGKAVTAARNRKTIKDHPLAYKAHNLVKRAIMSGKLKRMPCEVCGDVKGDAHHDDYTKPLEVRWLCRLHHAEVHKAKTETMEVL